MKTDKQLLASARLASEGKSLIGEEGLFKSNLDWDSLVRQAHAEGMEGFLYHQLKESGLEGVIPSAVQQALRNAYFQNLLSYQLKLKAVEEILEALAPEGVPIMLLQGMAILERIYPSAGLRHLSDIDFLIQRKDLAVVERILTHLGYVLLSRYPPVFVRDGVRLDLHVNISYLSRVEPDFNPLCIDDALLWKGAIPWRNGSSALIFCPTDQIILLSAHLQKHSFERLICFVDIGRLLNSFSSDGEWDTLFERAEQLRLVKPLYFVLTYLKEVLKVEVLENVPLPPASLNRIERRFLYVLLQNRRIEGMGDFLYLLAIDQPREQWRFFAKILFPPPKEMQAMTGSSSSWWLMVEYISRACHLGWLGLLFLGRLFVKLTLNRIFL